MRAAAHGERLFVCYRAHGALLHIPALTLYLGAFIALAAVSLFAGAKPGNFTAHVDDGPLLVLGSEIPIAIQCPRLRLPA